QILPYLQKAVAAGVKRPRLFASLSFAQLEGNDLAAAHASALKALDLASQDRHAWLAFARASFSSGQVGPLVQRLQKAFPDEKPDWAKEMRRDAVDLETKWQAEQKLRASEERANDLPRVRLIIEHRRFVRAADGTPSSKIESTGKGEVVLELFEDQAP